MSFIWCFWCRTNKKVMLMRNRLHDHGPGMMSIAGLLAAAAVSCIRGDAPVDRAEASSAELTRAALQTDSTAALLPGAEPGARIDRSQLAQLLGDRVPAAVGESCLDLGQVCAPRVFAATSECGGFRDACDLAGTQNGVFIDFICLNNNGNATCTGVADQTPVTGACTRSQLCLGQYVGVCIPMPQTAVTLSQTIDTGASSLCSTCSTTSGIDACVIGGRSISVDAGTTVRVTGTRPLILIASQQITVTGTLDAGSHRGGSDGPAASAGPCNSGRPPDPGSGGGGWGGSFSSVGGNGGDSNGEGAGIAPVTTPITRLRGGCPGSNGGNGEKPGGAGGHGGGAALLLAGQGITIGAGGVVTASGGSGSGGKGAAHGAGGGGGGTGGMIVIDAPTVRVLGQCFANGGGGGGGGAGQEDGSGGGESTAPNQRGAGGSAPLLAGGGGGGAFGVLQAARGSDGTNNGVSFAGAGGGGGGAGLIRVFATTQEGTSDPSHVSPRPQ